MEESTPVTMTLTERERSDETQAVPDVQRGGVHEGPDRVTWLQLYGTDTLYALPPLPRGIKHYTLGSAPDQDIVARAIHSAAEVTLHLAWRKPAQPYSPDAAVQ